MKLSKSQIEQLIENTRLDHKGENLYGTCPFCGHDEFGISITKEHNPFNCFRKKECGESGWVYKILKHLGRAKEFLSETPVDVFGSLSTSLGDDNIEITDSDLDLDEIAPPLLWKRVYEDEYLRKRGFTDSQFNKFEVGRSVLNPEYITILVRMNGRLVGYVSRSEKDKQWIDAYNVIAKQKQQDPYLRYDNSTTDFTKALFGYDEIIDGVTTDIILTEGIFSKTTTDTNFDLDNNDEIKCCCTFGAKVSFFQIELLKRKGIKVVHVWFEGDVVKKTKKIIGELADHFIVRVGYLGDKDPGDLDREQALQILEAEVDWVDFCVNFL